MASEKSYFRGKMKDMPELYRILIDEYGPNAPVSDVMEKVMENKELFKGFKDNSKYLFQKLDFPDGTTAVKILKNKNYTDYKYLR